MDQSLHDVDPSSAPSHGARATQKAFRKGTERVVPPAETIRRLAGAFGPFGITRVANVTGLDCIGVPVVMVCRPNARSLAVSQGKGLDLDAARASGLMEAIELYHAERVELPLRLASWNELRFSHSVVAVERLPMVSVSVFHPDRTLLWVQGLNLLDSKPLWLPYELVHTNFTLPLPTGSGCFVMSSNGLASGNHPLEAVIHGLCEVIERDATALFACRDVEEQEARRVDLSTIEDEDCRRVLELYERADVAVGVWEITSDIGVACFRCVVLDRNPSPFRRIGPVEGMGCHLVREVALLRALTEAAQGRLTLIAGSRDDNGRARYIEAQSESLIARAAERLKRRGSRPFSAAPTCVNETLEADLAHLLERLRATGFDQVIVCDLTKPMFGIPVARVVVPGLETSRHVDGYVPGPRARQVIAGRRGRDGE